MKYMSATPEYSISYRLTKKEVNMLIHLLTSSSYGFKYSTFILSLLKELDYDIQKVLRLLKTGSNKPKVFTVSLYKGFLMMMREAVVLSYYNEFSKEETSPHNFAKLEKAKAMDITRNYVINILKKHNLY